MKSAVSRLTRDVVRSRKLVTNHLYHQRSDSFDNQRHLHLYHHRYLPNLLNGGGGIGGGIVGSWPTSVTTATIATTRTISSSSLLLASQPRRRVSDDGGSEEVLNLPRKPVVFRTAKKDPATFDDGDVGLFYTFSMDKFNQLFQCGPEPRFKAQVKAINEPTFMIRKPFLEIRDLLLQTDFSQPNRRYVLYGRKGAGKSMTLNSLLHFASSQGWLLIQMSFPLDWFHKMTEGKTEISNWNPRRIDLPYIAADWLRNFKVQNAVVLAIRQDLVTVNTYKWSAREETPAGSHWNDLIDFGLERIRYSSDCVGALLKEIRLLPTHCSTPLRSLTTLDGINMFWMPTTLARADQGPKVFVPAETVSLVHNFKKMLHSDWTGGSVVATIDAWDMAELWLSSRMTPPYHKQSVNPREVLGEEGFNAVDPFYPVHIPYYDEKEYFNAMQFYVEKRIVNLDSVKSEQGIKEIEFLTNRNPGFLCDLSRVL